MTCNARFLQRTAQRTLTGIMTLTPCPYQNVRYPQYLKRSAGINVEFWVKFESFFIACSN